MNLELKAIRVNKHMSQETCCYTASLYLDGSKIADCSNRGDGGPDSIHPAKGSTQQLLDQVEWYCKSLNKCEYEATSMWIAKQIDLHELKKEVVKMCKRLTYIDSLTGNVYQLPVKFKPSESAYKQIKKAPWWKANHILLNELSIEDGVELLAMFD